MDLHELRVAARLIDGLAKRALFAEKQMVALEGQCAEWRRIADELKAARNLTTATAESVIKERDALREDLRREEESHEETAQLLKTVDQKVRLLTQERDALRAQLDTERERHKQTASVLAQYAPKPVDVPRAHPVAVGEWVERTSNEYDPNTKIGAVAQVVSIDADGDYQVAINGVEVCWSAEYCTPCDPPEATHDTPEGRASAESVIRDDRKTAPDEIKVGDVVRATFWKAGQAAVVKEILADGRLMLDCSDQPWRVDEVVKLMRKVTP